MGISKQYVYEYRVSLGIPHNRQDAKTKLKFKLAQFDTPEYQTDSYACIFIYTYIYLHTLYSPINGYWVFACSQYSKQFELRSW